MAKVKIVKLESNQGNGALIIKLDDDCMDYIHDELDDASVDDTFKITIGEMEEDELNNLPEFEGF